jgi:fluoride exporter
MSFGNFFFGTAYLLVMLGGAFGSLLRFAFLNKFALLSGSTDFPYGTLFVNIVGSFFMGVLIGMIPRQTTGYLADPFYWLFGIGFLGGFTTFSSFALDVLNIFYTGNKPAVAIYMVVSVFGSVAACFAGFWIVRSIASWL